MSRTKIQSKGPAGVRNTSLRRSEHAGRDSAHHDSATLGLDPVIHERMRLGIISALAVRDSLTFSELKKLLDASDGNLSVHARKLEEANYILCNKGFDGRVPRTEYRITSTGRKALENYLDHMEGIIHSTRRK